MVMNRGWREILGDGLIWWLVTCQWKPIENKSIEEELEHYPIVTIMDITDYK